MGGDKNSAVSQKIWEFLVTNSREILLKEAHADNLPLPILHPDCLTQDE